MQAHIYTRVSTDEQADEGYSLQAQERAGRLYSEVHGHVLVDVYCDEGYSGTTATRPAFQRMLASIQPGDIILVHKLDRFTRNVRLLLETLDSLGAMKITLVSISEQIDFSSPIGKVILTILAAFAQYYVDNLREETIKGNREKAQRGFWVGPVPVGYRKLDKGTIVPSDDAETVRELFRLYHEGLSFYEVAESLNERGLRPGGRVWGRENVRVVLKNRAYIGMVSSGGVEYQGSHDPLISNALWDETVARRAASTRPRAKNKRDVEPGPLSGLLYCAGCGKRLWFKYSRAESGTRSFHCRGYGRTCTGAQFLASVAERSADNLVDLVAAGDIHEVAERLYVTKGEIVRVRPTARYRRLLERIGMPIE